MNTHTLNLLLPIRKKLDTIEIHNSKLARFLCKVIPASCPFASDIKLFGNLIIHIPPLCKLNPLYEQLIGLRFRAICYLNQLD
ncbi:MULTISPECIES: Mo-dependent nitrogenase C-terminal domain-containing protein [unclassified Tolypothrix]|uniref:Mo-dependent nitrogenase C-terminal domain-containing protein n=1 Tax=unclassified Tolypothrix TaxID=2649714 RepID=UPI0005EAC653|nr:MULTISPECIES: Mo-dependent nitrogenase C-terminal domain-containing protein [unclassified Tolypothrix]BAY95690.1 Mo-dependent nitrogenase family protein [Microchaete diplosiphon NIES-3275]EKE96389.1 putative Mo-dependent nitrogenase [Tolypothrix sp. PCC 7601]MBE9083515.1 Mo-dependent nitrogenase C-terminal domain-containing protein [Tolypothrix sp. LEGE 11397]UYD30877.1 Mo-dependent nitrogenase C-terminal domain-containing protein [Tolypothrix sp. PCC 7712]UYD38568.1 Mo-dependent nitrogenas